MRPVRNRLVSFRLSEQEYAALRRFCAARGVRNVSDVARDAVARVVNGGAPTAGASGDRGAADLAGRTSELHEAMRRLTEAVVRLSGAIECKAGK